MKQKYWIILICLVAGLFVFTNLAMSKRQQEQMLEISRKMDEMNIKMDELDVETKSMASESKITASALKDADQRIKDLENTVNSSETKQISGKDPVKLVWVLYSVPSKLNDWPEVEAALNEYSAEKIGVTCEFKYLDQDEVSETLLNAHDFDITFTCNWWNDFARNVSAGNFLDLTDVLDKYPDLNETVLESAWAGTKVNDRIYAIPHMKDIGCEVFWILDSNYFLKEKGFEKDLDISFEEIEPYLKAYKDDHPDDYPIKVASSGLTSWQSALVDWLNMDTLVGLEWDAQGTDQEYVVKSALEIPAWRERLQTVHEWYKKGYINPDAYKLETMPRAESGVVQSGQGWFGAETIWANTI